MQSFKKFIFLLVDKFYIYKVIHGITIYFLRKISFPNLPSKINNFSFFKYNLSYLFWSFLCKKDKNLAKFYKKREFFNEKIDINDITFDKSALFNKTTNKYQIPDEFYRTGIIVIKEFLGKEANNEFLNFILNLVESTKDKKSFNYKFKDVKSTYERRNKNVEQYIHSFNSNLCSKNEWNICKELAFDFFGKNVFPKKIQLIHTFSDGIEEEDESSIIHVDRYLPAIKMFYSPKQIDKSQSPFQYIPFSHIIGNDYKKNVWKSIKKTNNAYKYGLKVPNQHYDHNYQNENLLSITCEANSLIIAATNGLHGRGGFNTNSKKERWLTFFSFYENYNKFSLLKNFFKNK